MKSSDKSKRKPKPKEAHVYMPPDLFDLVENEAKANDRSFTAQIRQICKERYTKGNVV
jgi:hypothetical protein